MLFGFYRRRKTMIKRMFFLTTIISIMLCGSVFAQKDLKNPQGGVSAPPYPFPVIAFKGAESYAVGGQKWMRYKIRVTNYKGYPEYMWLANPELPPCGANKNSSRTWVDIYAAQSNNPNIPGSKIFGFCTLKSSQDLDDLWFSVKAGQQPPPYVYIVIKERKVGANYKSNLINLQAGKEANKKAPDGND
jgi:hypothetical protein